MSLETQASIAEKLTQLVDTIRPALSPQLAKVKKVNQDDGYCECVGINNDEEYTRVRLMSSFNSNMLIVPKLNSIVILHFLNNMLTRAYISKYSQVSTIILSDDATIVIQHQDINIQVSTDKIKIKGLVEVEGDITVTGEVTAKSQTAPVNLSTHKHAGPAGPPIPNT